MLNWTALRILLQLVGFNICLYDPAKRKLKISSYLKGYALCLHLLLTIPSTVFFVAMFNIFYTDKSHLLANLVLLTICIKNWAWLIMLKCYAIELQQLLVDFLNVWTELVHIFGVHCNVQTLLPLWLIMRQILFYGILQLFLLTLSPLSVFVLPAIMATLIIHVLMAMGLILLHSFFNIARSSSLIYLLRKNRTMVDLWSVTQFYLNLFQLLASFEKNTCFWLGLEYFFESLLFICLLLMLLSDLDAYIKTTLLFVGVPLSITYSCCCTSLLQQLHAMQQDLCNVLLHFDMRFTWFKLDSVELFYLQKLISVDVRAALWGKLYLSKSVLILHFSLFVATFHLYLENKNNTRDSLWL